MVVGLPELAVEHDLFEKNKAGVDLAGVEGDRRADQVHALDVADLRVVDCVESENVSYNLD